MIFIIHFFLIIGLIQTIQSFIHRSSFLSTSLFLLTSSRRSTSTIGQFLTSSKTVVNAQSVTMSTSTPDSVTASSISINDRKKAALFGLYVGDATAMPVHWMYNLAQLQRDYGRITGYVKPKDHFEGSIMNLSNTGGGGRGSDVGDIIGNVINHGKKKYWGRGGNYHYHLGLDAGKLSRSFMKRIASNICCYHKGENTLEAQLTRLLTRTIIEKREYDNQYWLEKYIQFMTTPGSHNDTCKNQ